MALPLFAITLFVSAFLLFLVQPMIGKMILPKLGGTPQVWNTCMVFFQTALLAGYAYTHTLSTRFSTRRQLAIHGAVLAVPLLLLLLGPYGAFNIAGWMPPSESNPIPQTLLLLAIVVGVPFFVISTSAPLLQKWFTSTGHPAAQDPYFLYGASNLGSLLSLFFYPLFLEPWLPLRMQAYTWWVSYFILAAMVLFCAYVVWKSPLSAEGAFADGPAPDAPPPAPEQPVAPPPATATATAVKAGPAPGAARGITRKKGLKVGGRPVPAAEHARASEVVSAPRDDAMTWGRRLRWIGLAAVPSSLMLGVTSYVSTDLSPFPLLWVIPLALYLLSFILVYMKWPIAWTSSSTGAFTPHSLVVYVLHPLFILALCLILLQRSFSPGLPTILTFLGFFFTALALHGELAVDRPSTKHLTEYFLLMSVGGAVGGFFNGIIAPYLFPGVWEYPIAIVLACFLRPTLSSSNWFDNFLMNSSPGVQTWARDQSDQFSRSLNRQATGDTYVLSYALDVMLGLFVWGVAWFMRWQAQAGFVGIDQVFSFLKFVGFSPRSANQFVLPAYHILIYGVPMIFCFFFATRPIRFGLAVMGLLVVNLIFMGGREDTSLYAGRSYFGVLRVLEGDDLLFNRETRQPNDEEEFNNFAKAKAADEPQLVYKFSYLMHGTTYHGRNYTYRPGKDKVDLSRLATTYYHRYGPVGAVMERHNWFPGPQNTFWADARMPTTLVAGVLSDLGSAALPVSNFTGVMSEPAYATVGLGSGTMASYQRPYQHLTFYEIDEKIRDFSLPPDGSSGFFTYLQNAMRRGGNLEVVMGDARLTMERTPKEGEKFAWYLYPFLKEDARFSKDYAVKGDNFLFQSTMSQHRERYYKAIELDAFSSDAIPVHLVTIEAITMYLQKITDDGVLMVHTSNRHLDLVQPVTRIAEELADPRTEIGKRMVGDDARFAKLKYIVGKDRDQRDKYLGHFSSEYVMLYFDEKHLKPARDHVQNHNLFNKSAVEWGPPDRVGRSLWTDDFTNIVSIIR